MTATETETIELGRSGVQVCPLGIGTWAWGDRLFWSYGKGYGEEELRQAFDTALEHGITLFDTAEIYGRGRSERLLGEFIKASGAQIAVATKFAPYPWRLRQSSLRTALSGSLKRLGLEHVDLYQVHWPTALRSPERWAVALAEVVEAGLARAVGVSNYNAEQLLRTYEILNKRGIQLASNQIEYSLAQRAPETNGTQMLCRELGITLIAYSPLAMGVLSGKYTPQNPLPGLRGRRYPRSYLARLQPLLQLMASIGEAHGHRTTAQVALNWLICKGAVPIPGAKNLRQARDNAGALGWRLTEEEVAALDEASAAL